MHWLGRHRGVALALICALCTSTIIAAAAFQFIFANSIWTSETSFRDALERKARRTKVREDFVFLGIDEASKQLDQVSPEEIEGSPALQKMRQEYPWSRAVYAELIERLCDAGARLVIFDLTFDPDRSGDTEFRAALDRHRDRVVIGADIEADTNPETERISIVLVPPKSDLIPDGFMDDRVGFVSLWPDPDNRIRRINYAMTESQIVEKMKGSEPAPSRSSETIYESLDARSLRKLGFGDRIPSAGRSATIRFGPNNAYQPRSVFEVFVPAYWTNNYGNGAFFKDKVVLVGAASAIDHDVHPTPISEVTSGPGIHFHAMAAALDGEFLSETSPTVNLVLLVGAGFLAWLVVAFVRQTLVALLLLIGLGTGYLAGVVWFYNARDLFLLAIPVLAAFGLSGLFSLGYDFTLERLERLRTRRTLERYVSKNLVKEILENPSAYYNTIKGVRRPVTVLFSDLIGFTNLSEQAEPEELVSHLNELLSGMVGVVFENHGTLDKFIGDAIMAVWGNVRSAGIREDAHAAARTALGMRRTLKELNERWAKAGRKPLGMGTGINHGEAIVGNIGSYSPHERLDPTVIGDAVNLASRLEALTRTYGVDILIGEAAAELMRDEFHLRSVARVQVKGKSVPVAISALLGARDEPFDSALLRSLEGYEEGVREFQGRNFENARILFESFLKSYPEDNLAKSYLERTIEYERHPPGETWTAADVFTKK